MIGKIYKKVIDQRRSQRQAELYRNLIRREAKIGGQLFGPVPQNSHREFFCLDKRTLVWHEEWTNQSGKHNVVTTRYDLRPDGVLKAQDGQPYQMASDDEVRNLYNAMRIYKQRVKSELYYSV